MSQEMERAKYIKNLELRIVELDKENEQIIFVLSQLIGEVCSVIGFAAATRLVNQLESLK